MSTAVDRAVVSDENWYNDRRNALLENGYIIVKLLLLETAAAAGYVADPQQQQQQQHRRYATVTYSLPIIVPLFFYCIL